MILIRRKTKQKQKISPGEFKLSTFSKRLGAPPKKPNALIEAL